MATLKDVARLACCDVSTVSRALNNTSYVHPDTKARILAAVKELSYQPNVLAQGLRMGKRQTIGVVIPKLSMTVFAEILHGIEEKARDTGYSVLVCNTQDDPEIERESLSRLRNGFVDGIIIAGTGKNGRLIKDISVSGIPMVQVIRKQEENLSSLVADYRSCGYKAVKYLYEKGCRNIGLINGPDELVPYRERRLGYERAVKELDLKSILSSSENSVNSFEYGFHCAENLTENNKDLDGIIVAADIQGIGALRALKESGIRVPEDMKLISLTGHSIGGMLETSMTSMEIPAVEIGREAVNIVLEEIEAKGRSKKKNRLFATELVEREST